MTPTARRTPPDPAGGAGTAGVLLVGELHGRSGLADRLRALLGELADASNAEPGCVSFRVLAAEEPGDFVVLCWWSSEAGMREHYASSHYRRYRERVAPLLARTSDTVVHHLSGTVHAQDPDPPDPGLLG